MPASALAKAAKPDLGGDAANKNETGRPVLRVIKDEAKAIAAPGTRELQHQPEADIPDEQAEQASIQEDGINGMFSSAFLHILPSSPFAPK